jgi:hypothetical protein
LKKFVQSIRLGIEVQIQVYKQIWKLKKFVTESKEIFDVREADIAVELLKPVESKCSAQVDFTNYIVK